ncbi:hypothetical protein MKW94_006131 [Papaver nudicaule]|uniref:BTB domain-containing protein n=1 Tax=Papaver nudicaule TaxID=74823 RepID=A0AA41RQT7_PAPNU|nr:hypothetical protein [Papaver nudicaule]
MFVFNVSLSQQIRVTGEGRLKWHSTNLKYFDSTILYTQTVQNINQNLYSTCGDEAVPNNDSSWMHVSFAILAAKSPFFYKLFSNGTRESEQRYVTLRINASEEAALIGLLKFMYTSTLSVTTATGLLDVLMAADKFEVSSCMRYCSRLLHDLPMTPDSALLYLEIPSSVSKADAVQPLMDAAKQYLASRYKDLLEFAEELLNLPLAGIEAVLSRDDLQVDSENEVYDFVLKWARLHYPKIEDRREVLGSRLGRLIRFPFMSCWELDKVLTCDDFDHDHRSKVVLEAFRFKAEAPYRRRTILAMESAVTNRRYVERVYKFRPMKVVEFENPHQQCFFFLDLKREECENLFPCGRVQSQLFHLAGQVFILTAQCNTDDQRSPDWFGLFLGMQEIGLGPLARRWNAMGCKNLFVIPWTDFMADDSPYFISGVLHLSTQLTIKH